MEPEPARSELDDLVNTVVKLAPDTKPSAKAKRWCITYRSHVCPDIVRNLVNSVMTSRAPYNNRILDMFTCNVVSSRVFPFKHMHVLVSFEYPIRIQTYTIFDTAMDSAEIRTIGTIDLWKRCVETIPKEQEVVYPPAEVETQAASTNPPSYIADLKLFRDPSIPALKSAYAGMRMYLEYRKPIERKIVLDWWEKYVMSKDAYAKVSELEYSSKDGFTLVAIMLTKAIRIRCSVKKLEIEGVAPLLRSIATDNQWRLCVSHVRGVSIDTLICQPDRKYRDTIYGTPYSPITPDLFTPWQKQLHDYMRDLIGVDSIRDNLVKEALPGSIERLKAMDTKITVVHAKTNQCGRSSFATAYKNSYYRECWNCQLKMLTGDLFSRTKTELCRLWGGETIICVTPRDFRPEDIYEPLRSLRSGVVWDRFGKQTVTFRPVSVVLITSHEDFSAVKEDDDWKLFHVNNLHGDLIGGPPIIEDTQGTNEVKLVRRRPR